MNYKIYIAQVQKGREREEIELELQKIRYYVSAWLDREVQKFHYQLEFIDNNVPNPDYLQTQRPYLGYLGECIKKMADADMIVFGPSWHYNSKCRCENEVAMEYNFRCLYIDSHDLEGIVV